MSRREGGKDGGSGSGHGGGQVEQPPSSGRTVAEWTTFAISAAIIAAVVGLLLYQQLAGGDRPATIVVSPRLDALRQEADAYYVPIDVANRGDKTAEAVRLRVTLDAGGSAPEIAELLIDLLAGGATAHSVAVFRADPRRGTLAVGGVSYLEP